jgi:hypothetical protein
LPQPQFLVLRRRGAAAALYEHPVAATDGTRWRSHVRRQLPGGAPASPLAVLRRTVNAADTCSPSAPRLADEVVESAKRLRGNPERTLTSRSRMRVTRVARRCSAEFIQPEKRWSFCPATIETARPSTTCALAPRRRAETNAGLGTVDDVRLASRQSGANLGPADPPPAVRSGLGLCELAARVSRRPQRGF